MVDQPQPVSWEALRGLARGHRDFVNQIARTSETQTLPDPSDDAEESFMADLVAYAEGAGMTEKQVAEELVRGFLN